MILQISQGNQWSHLIKDIVKKSDGFILVVPEYGGMATPVAKNIFLLCGNGEFAHKPGLIVSVSSGNVGAYPKSELRMSSYKNTHIMWIPCLLYTSPSPRDLSTSRMPSSA